MSKTLIEDLKEQVMHGILEMSAEKGGWLSKKKLLIKHGFEKVDEIDPYFLLYAKIFNKNVPNQDLIQ
ncbi:MAG: hypothetical protein ACFFCE_02915 [Promethearchaeota archaeon]